MLHLQHHLRCLSRVILSPDGELPSDDIRSEDRCTLAMIVALFSVRVQSFSVFGTSLDAV